MHMFQTTIQETLTDFKEHQPSFWLPNHHPTHHHSHKQRPNVTQLDPHGYERRKRSFPRHTHGRKMDKKLLLLFVALRARPCVACPIPWCFQRPCGSPHGSWQRPRCSEVAQKKPKLPQKFGGWRIRAPLLHQVISAWLRCCSAKEGFHVNLKKKNK